MKTISKQVAQARRIVKKFGQYKNISHLDWDVIQSLRKKVVALREFIQKNKKDKLHKRQEDNVWEFTNQNFTAQYTIGKNGKVFKRLHGKYNQKPCWGKWEETENKEISDNFKKECKSYYINHRA